MTNTYQITFPHIVSDKHPLADGSHVLQQPILKLPDKTDYRLADEILSIRTTVRDVSDGAWKWIHENKNGNYLTSLAGHDQDTLASILVNFFQSDAIFGLANLDSASAESDFLLDLDTWREFTEQKDLSVLATSEIGNPSLFKVDDTLISHDNPRFNYYALQTLSLAPHSVLEIGGGYGGLALMLSKLSKEHIRYINIDLPETLYLAYYFLSRSGVNVKWALDDIPEADVVLVPADKKHLVKGHVDVVLNSYSFSEMGKASSDEYLSLINAEWQPRHFFHENSNFLLFPNSERHIEILARDFPIDKAKYRKVYQAISPWQGSGGRGREFLYQRID